MKQHTDQHHHQRIFEEGKTIQEPEQIIEIRNKQPHQVEELTSSIFDMGR